MPNKFEIKGTSFVLPAENVDTDQIYPARYLTTTVREGLGQFCFRDWRDNPDSAYYPVFDRFDPARHSILVTGSNFGNGSSREHAVWSLLDMGFKAVISTRFGDIFRNNALKNGLVPVQVSSEIADHLLANPELQLTIDLAAPAIEIPGLGSHAFPIDRFAARCIIEGTDSLDFLLGQADLIAEYELKHQPGG